MNEQLVVTVVALVHVAMFLERLLRLGVLHPSQRQYFRKIRHCHPGTRNGQMPDSRRVAAVFIMRNH